MIVAPASRINKILTGCSLYGGEVSLEAVKAPEVVDAIPFFNMRARSARGKTKSLLQDDLSYSWMPPTSVLTKQYQINFINTAIVDS